MESIISGKNSKLLKGEMPEERQCSCPRNGICPLNGKCLNKNIVYHATVTAQNEPTANHVGLCSTTFKARLAIHDHSFDYPEDNQTSLSHHILELKSRNVKHQVKWETLGRAPTYSPITGVCALCTKEKYFIMFHPEKADLNSKSEIYTNCRHKQSKLLVPKPPKVGRKRRKG